jgi:hypothetical protein
VAPEQFQNKAVLSTIITNLIRKMIKNWEDIKSMRTDAAKFNFH